MSMSMPAETNLVTLGEKGFLSGLLQDLYTDPMLLSGFGHDAAVIEIPNAPFNLTYKIDRASYPVSMKQGWSGYQTWGQMAVTANCSDILASGGQPIACMIAVMVPGDELVHNVRDIVVGASDECRRNDIIFAGGDTKEALDPQVVGTAIGVIEKNAFLPRNTAKPGDKLFCAGRIGGFAGAFFMLRNVFGNASSGETKAYVDYLSRPVAQWRVARMVNTAGLARCGMDASDGLLDVLQTFASHGVQLQLNLDAIPYHPFAIECARRTKIPLTQLMFGGGDWNILYCVPAEHADELAERAGDVSLPLYRVGEVSDGEGVFAVDGAGIQYSISGVVNEHFKDRIEDAAGFMDHIENDDFIQGRDSS